MTEKQYQELCARAGISPLAGPGQRKAHKYNAVKKEVDGVTFDSAGEARAGSLLMLWEKAGAISKLERQPRYTLMDGYVDPVGRKVRPMQYVPDFRFIRAGQTVVVDFKGMKTEAYKLKAKLFRQRYPDLQFEEWTLETLKQNGV
jgi:hypothetical protein